VKIANWRKSPYSGGGSGGGCVESGDDGDVVGYRDSTQAGLVDRPEITVSREAGRGLQAALLAGRFDVA
jgi:hypothetical protein